MVIAQYEFPLPNDGIGYKFSEKELIKLLDKVYKTGYQHGRDSMRPCMITTYPEDKDDNTQWKEAWTK